MLLVSTCVFTYFVDLSRATAFLVLLFIDLMFLYMSSAMIRSDSDSSADAAEGSADDHLFDLSVHGGPDPREQVFAGFVKHDHKPAVSFAQPSPGKGIPSNTSFLNSNVVLGEVPLKGFLSESEDEDDEGDVSESSAVGPFRASQDVLDERPQQLSPRGRQPSDKISGSGLDLLET